MIAFAALFAIAVVFILFVGSILQKDTVVVFCNVGQGDGAYLRINNRIDILIDAGPDQKILSCLGKYMPFYDRKIELAFLTHPEKDHYGGYIHVADRYTIEQFIASPVGNANDSFAEFVAKLAQKHVSIKSLYRSDFVKVMDAEFRFIWPDKNYVRLHTENNSRAPAMQKNDLGPYSNYFRATAYDPNAFSQIFVFSQRSKRILFTGDITNEILDSLLDSSVPNVNIIKIPHHGSANGLNKKFLKLADPEVSVISAGRNNRYGHPHKEILGLLNAAKSKIKRTDIEGNIVFYFGN